MMHTPAHKYVPPTPKSARPTCAHKVNVPFDPERARGLESHEVRQRWPRFVGSCPQCGERLISYASLAHYIAGDW